MAIERGRDDFARLSSVDIESWKSVPVAVAGDAMNRARCMVSGIHPLMPTMRVVGQARTVQVAPGDNAAIHVAVALARPGDVLVIDAGGYTDVAVWGGILTTAAVTAGIGGVVLDGATRDSSEAGEAGLPLFCRGVVPRGGMKSAYGAVDMPIAVGGVAVTSGDIVLGDADGVAIVPLARATEVRKAVDDILEREAALIAGIRAGKHTAELLNIPIPEITAR